MDEMKKQLVSMQHQLEQQLLLACNFKHEMEFMIASVNDRFNDAETFCRVFLQSISDVRNIQADLVRVNNQIKVIESMRDGNK